MKCWRYFSLEGLTLKKQPNKKAAESAEMRPVFILLPE